MIQDPILLVDDEAEVRETLMEALQGQGFTVATAASAEEALARMAEAPCPVVVTDLHMPDGLTGLDLIRALKERHPDTLCVMITAFATLDTSIEALKLGAYDFIQKPFRLAEMEVVLSRALEHAALLRQVRAYQDQLEARIASRTQDLQRVQQEALTLCDLSLQALEARNLEAALAPLLDRLTARWAPTGLGVFRRSPDGRLRKVASAGPRTLPDQLERPTLGDARSPGLGYAEEHLLPLGASGWLYLGFDERTAFQDTDPVFRLAARHIELLLRVR